MSDYQKIKKLDEESAQMLTEGTGPSDQCICSLLYEPKERGFRQSIKKAFSFVGGKKNRYLRNQGEFWSSNPTGKKAGMQLISKEVVKHKSSCGKCGCDSNDMVTKHSYANIRIVTPDISSICPCPVDCLPEKTALQNNIKVTIERVEVIYSDDVSRNTVDCQKNSQQGSLDRTSPEQTSSCAESMSPAAGYSDSKHEMAAD